MSTEDIDQALGGKSVVKIAYLPDVADPDLPPGIETLVSSRLDPSLDPIKEADRRGTILANLRAGKRSVDDGARGRQGKTRGSDQAQGTVNDDQHAAEKAAHGKE